MPAELLNTATAPATSPESAAADLATALEALRARHYDEHRRLLDYGAVAVSREFAGLRGAVNALAGTDPDGLGTARERIAFWLNAYNALVIHAVIARRIQTTIRRSSDFFEGPHYCIGGRELTLDVIEHGLLRGNRKKYMGLAPLLGRRDPRLAWAPPRFDPRIHFGLYTASRSSPDLEAFRPEGLGEQLGRSAQRYLDRHVTVDVDTRVVRLPSTFRWYAGDFGEGDEEVLAFVRDIMPDDERTRVLRAAAIEMTIQYTEYDWSLNDRYAEQVAG